MSGPLRRDDKGVAAVEFALVAPFLLALIFGIVEFGWLWSYKADLNNATATAAREFTLNNSAVDPAASAKAAITSNVGGVSNSDITICVGEGSSANCTTPTCAGNPDEKVTVTVTTDTRTLTNILSTSVPVSSEFVALCQADA